MSFGFLMVIGALFLIFRCGLVKSTGLSTAGIRGEFFKALDAVPTQYQNLATRIASTTAQENYKWLGSVPQMREFGNGRLAKGLRTESYSVENLKYEATLEVDRDEISDDQLGQIRVRINELAQRAATHKDYLIAQLLVSGATAGFNAYDGLTFFNANHVSGASGVQSNLITQTAATNTTPTTAEFKAGVSAAIERMLSFKDDQGQPMMFSASGLKLLVPPPLLYTAMEAMNATLINNTDNVLRGAAEVIPFPWLTAADYCYLLKTDVAVRPFIFQDREPLEFTSLAEGSEEEFNREKYLYGVRARYRMTYGYWQYAVSIQFT